MKTILFVGTHKNFSGLRLGAALGTALALRGQEVLLAGSSAELPSYLQLSTVTVSPKATTKTLAALLKKNGIERVISLAYLPGCEAASSLNIPFVYIEPENFKEDKPAKNKKTLLSKAARVVVIGPGEKALNKKIYPENTERVTNPAIWVEHYNYHRPSCFKKENNIVAAGSFGKDGGFDVLLQTWARLAPAHTTWHLTLVGYGAGKAALQKVIEKNALQKSTELVDADTDLYSLLRNADIYVNPARNAQGIDELLDAMASKLPVITTDVPGADYYVQNGINGLVVNVAEEEPLTVALDELMVNWGKRVGIAIEASKQKEKFPFEDFVSHVLI